MVRRIVPLLAVIPIGVVVGLLASSEDLSSGARLALIAAIAIPVVLVGTPFALLRWRPAPLPPHVGRASEAGWQLSGVHSDFPIDPVRLSKQVTLHSTDPAMLLPTVRPGTAELRGSIARLDLQDLRRVTERVQVVEITDPGKFDGCLRVTPNDVTLWPRRRRRPWYHTVLRRMRKALARFPSGRGGSAGDHRERVIDHPAV